jgi:cell division GTPase FtsZ
MPILPDLTESTVAQLNTLQVFKELDDLDICILPVDNQQIKQYHNSIGKGDMYQIVNNSTVDLIEKLVSYTDMQSKDGNLDKKDLKTLLSTKGLCLISEVNVVKLNQDEELLLTESGITQSIQKSWIKSVFTPNELSKITRAAIVFDGQRELQKYLDYRNIFSKFDNEYPIDLFEGIYHEQKGTIISVLTGLSFCKTRLSKIDEIIQSKVGSIEKVMSHDEEKYQPKSLLINLSKTIKKKQKSATDILAKYRR